MANAFPRLDGLVRLAHSEGVDIRRPLLRVLTDLYVQEASHTREEEQQYVELTLRLLPAVDVTTRTAVARKLAEYGLTPAPIIEALLQDVPEVAKAMRDAVSRAYAAASDAKEQPATDVVAEQDMRAPIASEGSAEPTEVVGETAAAGETEEVGERIFRMERDARVEFLDHDDEEEFAAFDRLGLPARPGTEARLERAAMATNVHEFSRELRYGLGISGRVAARIVQDESGEALLIAACALDLSREVLLRVLLFLNPKIGHSVERVFSLYRLYPRLSQEAVVAVVESWRREAAARGASRYQSQHADDARNAASAREGTRQRETAAPGRRETAADPRKRA